MKRQKRLIAIMSLFIIVALFSFIGLNVKAAVTGLGTVKYTYSRTILKDMDYTFTQSDNGSPQKAYVLEYDSSTTQVDAMAVYGNKLFGGDTISTNVSLLQQKGYTVIAGVNASPFDTSNGVTVGTTIQNGRIVCSQSGALSSNYDNYAFCKDGTAYIGHPNFEFSFTNASNQEIKINYLNRQKKTANDYVYLISSDYYTDTTSLANSTEAVLTINKGDLIVGTTIECTVDSVKENTTRTKVESGKLILVGSTLASLGNIKANDKITISIKDNDSAFDWTKVTQTISGFYQILADGEVMSNLYTRSDRNDTHPRTTLGYTKEGKIVIYVADGRQSGIAVGMTDIACAEYMKELGCVAAIRMDGGGSSNLSLRLPGDENLTTVNVPSDGEERHDADAFLFVLKSDYNTTPDDSLLLHAYPNDLKLLEGTVVDVDVKATDNNYNPKTTPEYTMTASDNCGTIIDGTKFQARKGSGIGKITIASGSVSTSVNVSVTDKVDELYATVNNLTMGPGEKASLGVKAYLNDELLQCSNESFSWSCDASIGTIDQSGNFTGTSDSGKNGYIYIKYGTITAKVGVSIGQLPKEITGFEEDSCGSGYGQWKNSQVNGGSGSCSINEDLEFVRFGTKSLRIDFNLANTTGTVGTQIWTGASLSVTGTPTAIGMWVYGTESAQGAWIRLQYSQSGSTGALYADFGHIDWTGWKYLEAQLDESVKYPVAIKYLVRIMGVAESERINGTIYVDNLRAVYGFTNDDTINPVINNMEPGDSGVSMTTTQTVGFDITDEGTGINKDKTTFFLDDEQITNLQYKDIEGGFYVTWTPSALIPLSKGAHTVKVRCEDNYGNYAVKTWNFIVDPSLPTFDFEDSDTEFEIGETSSYTIISTSKQFNKINMEIAYNQTTTKINQVKSTVSGIDVKLISDENGVLTLEITNSELAAGVTNIVTIDFEAINAGEVTFTVNSLNYTNSTYTNTFTSTMAVYSGIVNKKAETAITILETITTSIDDFFNSL